MTQRPLPPDLTKIVISYEEDYHLQDMREFFFHHPPDEMEFFFWSKGFKIRVIKAPFSGPDGCYLLRRIDKDKPPLREDTYKIRAALARHIGLEPAAFYEFIPHEYDSEFLKTYRYSFSTRCKHGSLSCIRPSHLIPTTYDGRPLR